MSEKKVVMIIPPCDFRDEELFEPKRIFEDNNVNVKVASVNEKKCFGMLRGEIQPDLILAKVDVTLFDAVIFSSLR